MKTLIIHDRFQFRGGAERLVLIMAKALKADLMTEFWTKESFDKPISFVEMSLVGPLDKLRSLVSTDEVENKNKNQQQKLYILDQNDSKIMVWRYFRAQKNFLFKTRKIIRQYERVIFSGNNCLSAAIHLKKNQKRLLYCHSPVRHVFDLFKKFRNEQKKLWKRILYYDLGAWGIRIIYWLGLSRFKIVVANSKNVQNRLWKYCRKKSQVIWPPIQTHKFKWLGQGDYYLSFGRVDKLKRVIDIVRAFQKMPDKKLIVCSGGDDLENVKKLAQGYNNIQVLGWVSEQRLEELISRCIASIYIPVDEDFGMTPLEGMSAGKPCIGVDEGGLKETIINEVNGKFVSKDYSTQDLIDAVRWLTPEIALSMRENCEKQAKGFGQQRFIEEIKKLCYS